MNKLPNEICFDDNDSLPLVSVIMAVHNGETFIKQKIESLIDSRFPEKKLQIFIGSDNSTDETNNILRNFSDKYDFVHSIYYEERQGKVKILNDLATRIKTGVYIFTDLYALPHEDAILHLLKHFKNKKICVVAANLVNVCKIKGLVSVPEESYLKQEISLKYAESILWGKTLGANGAFFAMRVSDFQPIPDKLLADDFYLSFRILQERKKAILELKARVYEQISGNISDEFNRKKRIAAGNFQNLKVFYPILFSRDLKLAFSFFSHKVLRWFGPIFILLIIISTVFLLKYGILYQIFAGLLFFSLIIPFIDYFFRKIGIHIVLLRFITHFYYMNLALLTGLIKFIKGIKSNVWEPTNRE